VSPGVRGFLSEIRLKIRRNDPSTWTSPLFAGFIYEGGSGEASPGGLGDTPRKEGSKVGKPWLGSLLASRVRMSLHSSQTPGLACL
jgi:hypothetical protein